MSTDLPERLLPERPLTPEEWQGVLQRRAAGLEGAERFDRRRAWRCLSWVALWYLAGAAILGLSFHLYDEYLPTAAFYLGLLAGNAGAFFTWYFMYIWNRDPGD